MYLPRNLSALLMQTVDSLQGRGVWSAYRRLSASQWWPHEQISALQSDKLAARIRFAAERSPLIARRLAEYGLSPTSIRSCADLTKLPILEKEDFQNRFDDLMCSGLPRREVIPNSTGGSTGVNVRFAVDRQCWRERNGATLRRWEFLGLRPGLKVATVWGSPMDQAAARRLVERVRRLIDNLRFFSAYRIGADDVDRILDWLGRHRPDVVVGYPSVLDTLARRSSERGGLDSAKYVISAAETLLPDQRQRIKQGMGAEVFNLYGCREFGLIGLECAEHHGLHIMNERLVVEVAPGEGGPGELIITDLDNNATPFIRYRIGDLAPDMGSTECGCGRGLSRIGEPTGRAFEVIRGPAGEAVGGTFWSLLLRTAVQGVRSFQVVQDQLDHLEIRITPRGGLGPEGRSIVTERIRAVLGPGMRVDFVDVDELEPLASGKHRFVVSALSHASSPDSGGRANSSASISRRND